MLSGSCAKSVDIFSAPFFLVLQYMMQSLHVCMNVSYWFYCLYCIRYFHSSLRNWKFWISFPVCVWCWIGWRWSDGIIGTMGQTNWSWTRKRKWYHRLLHYEGKYTHYLVLKHYFLFFSVKKSDSISAIYYDRLMSTGSIVCTIN